jgi:MoaA/NifB/PqqE/SkfB family radical SAM enzyme
MLGGSFWNTLRYGWLMLTKGPHLGSDFLGVTNRRFCNGPDKVIGWTHGYPSYYLMSPPLFSRPAMNSLTTRLMSIYQWRKLPDMVSVGVTDACNLHCEFCSFEAMRKLGKPPLSPDELKAVIRQAQELGASTINIVGGEPLLREDLCDLIRAVDPELSQVTLFTNGTRLAERARSLRQAGLTSVIVALDAAQAEEHDHRKGETGAFTRALEGIAAARKAKLLVGISTVTRPADLASGELVRVFELGRQLGVNQILVFDAVVGKAQNDQKDQQDPGWVRAQLQAIVDLCAAYHRKKDYPGIHSYAFSKSHRGLGCAGGVSHCYVSAQGEVCPCDFDATSVGNVREAPLYELWERFSQRGMTCTSLRGCRLQPGITAESYGPLASCGRQP